MEKFKKKTWETKNLKEIFFPTLSEDGSVILDYYVRIMLFFYPLFLVQDHILQIFTGKALLYYVVTFFSSAVYLFFLSRKTVVYAFGLSRTECLFLLAALLLMIKAVVRIFQGDMGYEKEMFLWCLIGTYFLLKSFDQACRYYLDLILFSAFLLQAGAIKYFIWGGESIPGVDKLCTWPEAGASYYLLAACTASVLYCSEKRKKWDKFYFIMAVFGYLTLFLLGDMGAICLAFLFLLAIPLAFPATVALVKRNLALGFSFLFIGSNLPLLQYIKNSLLKDRYDLGFGICIDIFLCLMGILISRHWEKVPVDRNPDAVILKRLRSWYARAVTAIILLSLICLLAGARLDGLPERFGIKELKAFGTALGKAASGAQSFPMAVLGDYGTIGCGLWLGIVILLLERVKKRWQSADGKRKNYLMLSALFLAQTFLYRIQPVSGPVYMIIMALALGGGGKTKKPQADQPDFQGAGRMYSKGDWNGRIFEKNREENPGI